MPGISVISVQPIINEILIKVSRYFISFFYRICNEIVYIDIYVYMFVYMYLIIYRKVPLTSPCGYFLGPSSRTGKTLFREISTRHYKRTELISKTAVTNTVHCCINYAVHLPYHSTLCTHNVNSGYN